MAHVCVDVAESRPCFAALPRFLLLRPLTGGGGSGQIPATHRADTWLLSWPVLGLTVWHLRNLQMGELVSTFQTTCAHMYTHIYGREGCPARLTATHPLGHGYLPFPPATQGPAGCPSPLSWALVSPCRTSRRCVLGMSAAPHRSMCGQHLDTGSPCGRCSWSLRPYTCC